MRRAWDRMLYWVAVISFAGLWFPFAVVLIIVIIGTWILAGGRT